MNKTKITYEDMVQDLQAVDEAYKQDPLAKYSVEITGEMKTPDALRVLSIIDEVNSFEKRAQFTKELLVGCHAVVYKGDDKVVDIGVTQGTEWWSVDAFNKNPLALKALVNSVYTRFLKNFVA